VWVIKHSMYNEHIPRLLHVNGWQDMISFKKIIKWK
jgi:hypothetical protein